MRLLLCYISHGLQLLLLLVALLLLLLWAAKGKAEPAEAAGNHLQHNSHCERIWLS